MSGTAIINIHQGHDDFVVASGVGPIINYHGKAVDLRAITLRQAEEIARDHHHRCVRFSDRRMERDAKAAIPAKPATPATKATEAKSSEAPAAKAADASSPKPKRRDPDGE